MSECEPAEPYGARLECLGFGMCYHYNDTHECCEEAEE